MMYTFQLHFSGSFVSVTHEGQCVGTIQPDFTDNINFSSDSRLHAPHQLGGAMWDQLDEWALSTGLRT